MTRLLLRLLVAVLLLAAPAAPGSPLFLRVAPLDLCAGHAFGTGSTLGTSSALFLGLKALDVAFGSRISRRLYWAAGTSLFYGRPIDNIAYAPLYGWLLWDLNPWRRGRKGFAYARATFVYNEVNGWNGGHPSPYLVVNAGISYTAWLVTPYAEVGYNQGWRQPTAALGLALGGNYVAGRRN